MKDDMISRQAAINVIDAVFPVDPMKSEYAQGSITELSENTDGKIWIGISF